MVSLLLVTCSEFLGGDTKFSREFGGDYDAPGSSEDLVLQNGKNSSEMYVR